MRLDVQEKSKNSRDGPCRAPVLHVSIFEYLASTNYSRQPSSV